MGQKVHPYGLRLGIIRTWNSVWFREKNYADWLHEDLRIRKHIKTKLYHAGISNVDIKRTPNRVDVFVHTSKPGLVIGKKGKGIEQIKKDLQKFVSADLNIDIQEARKAETNAQLVAENVATQIERRVSFRRAMKKALGTAMKLGALGFKIECSGRLGGTEMSRREQYKEGRIPLHTLRANIEYGLAEAKTTAGIIGVKVWVFHGDVYSQKPGGRHVR
jgi:small subunit ribosomal protein S3